MAGVFGVAAFFAILAFGIAQFAIGFLGIEDSLGALWAWLALIAALLFRVTLPITIGSFFGAMNVMGWHWAAAALFAAPGLAFVIPGAIAWVISLIRR